MPWHVGRKLWGFLLSPESLWEHMPRIWSSVPEPPCLFCPVFAGPQITVATTVGNKLIFGRGTRVLVKPNITDPQPAVYQLRNTKSSDLSLCLLTDFDSKTNVSRGTEPVEFITSQTVLNMKSLDSKSYGALAWSQKRNLSCSGAFNESNFLPSSDAFCNAKLVEKSFETDMNLNFQNLSVIGLRLLLLKVAGFNLLMTLRLWSS